MKNTINKYSITVILIGMILVNFSYAQSDISGGGGTGHAGASNSGYYVGWDANTTFDLDIKHLATGANAKNINFYTRATQKMTILGNNGSTDGFVGIGTTSPNYLLTQDGGTGNASYHQFINGATTGTGTNDGFLVGIDGSGNGILNCRGGTPINFLTSGAKRMKIQGGGSLLIGDYSAATAYNQLVQYVGGNVSVYHGFVNGNTGVSNTSGNDGFKMGITYNSGSSKSDAELISQQSGANINLYTSNGSVTNRMQIAAGGNVGIGTTGANNLVQMHGGFLQLTNSVTNATGGDGFLIGPNASNAAAELNQQEAAAINFLTSGTQRMSITSGGDVGIGTTSPGAKLHNVASFNTSGASIGAKFENTNTSSGVPSNPIGIKAISTVTSGSYHDGLISEIHGGNICRGFLASVDNTTNSSTNYGYYASITDNAPTTASYAPKNIGFGCEYVPVGSANSALNYGYLSILGSGSSYHSPTSMTGMYVLNYNGETSNGVVAELLTTNSSSSAGTSKAIVGASGPYGGNASYAVYDNYGGYFSAKEGTHLNYGIYSEGTVGTCSGTPPSTATCTDAAGFFSGDVGVTGTVFSTSDAFLKDNVQPIVNAIGTISQLNPVSYNFKTQDYPSMNLQGGTQYGVIAQDLQNVLPDLTRGFIQPAIKDDAGNIVHTEVNFRAVNYIGIIPILIAAVNELQAEIQALQANPKPAGPTPPYQKEVKLFDKTTVVLEQNNPNPFKENTTINFNIPGDVKQAQILFYNGKGNVISTVEITEKGAGSLLVYGADLTSGVYTYSLLIDNRVAETKKMMKVK